MEKEWSVREGRCIGETFSRSTDWMVRDETGTMTYEFLALGTGWMMGPFVKIMNQ